MPRARSDFPVVTALPPIAPASPRPRCCHPLGDVGPAALLYGPHTSMLPALLSPRGRNGGFTTGFTTAGSPCDHGMRKATLMRTLSPAREERARIRLARREQTLAGIREREEQAKRARAKRAQERRRRSEALARLRGRRAARVIQRGWHARP